MSKFYKKQENQKDIIGRIAIKMARHLSQEQKKQHFSEEKNEKTIITENPTHIQHRTNTVFYKKIWMIFMVIILFFFFFFFLK